MNAPDLGDLGSFPTQGDPRLFRVGPPEGQPTQGDELTRLLVRFADGVVVAVVVAWSQLQTWGLHRVHGGGSKVIPIVGVKEFLLHRVDALDLSFCRCFPAKRRYSCSLGVVAVRRPSHRLGGLGVGRNGPLNPIEGGS